MFTAGEWFARYPVTVRDGNRKRLAWLETVWRDRTLNNDGSVYAARYFAL